MWSKVIHWVAKTLYITMREALLPTYFISCNKLKIKDRLFNILSHFWEICIIPYMRLKFCKIFIKFVDDNKETLISNKV